MLMFDLLLNSTAQTLLMIFVSGLLGFVLGLPLSFLLFRFAPSGLSPCSSIYQPLSFVINAMRSVPYLILMVLMIPCTRFVCGSAIGTWASIVPLTCAASLLFARVIEDALNTVPKGLIEVGISMGIKRFLILLHIIFHEAIPQIISGSTMVLINLVGFSAMAGAVGGGGLGDLAIRYGYQRYELGLMLLIVVILMTLVQIIQFCGDRLYAHTKH